jgi:diphthamide biosynthesis protein 4
MSQKDLPIFAEVDLDDMNFNENTKTFSLPCRYTSLQTLLKHNRCGGEGFSVTESELEENIDRVYCGSCSLMIKILYDIQE